MNIDHPAVQEYVKVAMPWYTPEKQAENPQVAKFIIACLYFDRHAPHEVKVQLQVKPTSNDLKNQADRRKSMETYNYLQGDSYGRE